MRELEAHIHIDRSPAEVWAVLGDFHGLAAWAPPITSAVRSTGPEIGVGSRRTVYYRGVLRMEEAVTEWVEGERLGYDVHAAPFPLRHFSESWSITPGPCGVRVTARVRYEVRAGPLGEFIHTAISRPILRREMAGGLAGLKRFVEDGA